MVPRVPSLAVQAATWALVGALAVLGVTPARALASKGIDLVAAPVGAEPERKTSDDALLFSTKLLRAIEAARRAAAATRPSPATAPGRPPTVAFLHLSTIVYHGPEDWRVWLDGTRFTPANRPGLVEIVTVTPATVDLVWHGEPRGPTGPIRLAPNQSYLTRGGVVVEGLPAVRTADRAGSIAR